MRIKTETRIFIIISMGLMVFLFLSLITSHFNILNHIKKSESIDEIARRVFIIKSLSDDISIMEYDERITEQLDKNIRELNSLIAFQKRAFEDHEERKILDNIALGLDHFENSVKDLYSNGRDGQKKRSILYEEITIGSLRMYELSLELKRKIHAQLLKKKNEDSVVLFLFGSLLLFLVFFVSIRIVKKILKPLFEIDDHIERYTDSLDYEEIEIKEDNEIGDFKKTLNEMHRKLKKTLVSRDKLNKQLTLNTQYSRELKKEKDIAREMEKKANIADEAKSAFLTNLSHEIRTPLTGIMATLELLKNEITDEEQLSLLDMSYNSSLQLKNIFDELYDVVKFRTGKITLDKTTFDIYELLAEIHDTFKLSAKEKGIEFKYEIEEIPQMIISDKTRIRQILNNLVGNAVKFTQTGTVKLAAVFKRTDKATGQILFSISDTGIGMSEEVQRNIYKLFYQADLSLTKPFEGLGLGIPIVGKIVEKMNGKIFMNSTEGKGSIFKVYIPVRYFGHSEEKNGFNQKAFSPEKRILVVDDSMINRFIVKKILHKYGLKYDEAYDGFNALEKFENEEYDLVLLDIQMPLMDGFEVREKMYELNSDVPVLALTVYASADDKKKILGAGFDGYLSKPFEGKELIEMIKMNLLN